MVFLKRASSSSERRLRYYTVLKNYQNHVISDRRGKVHHNFVPTFYILASKAVTQIKRSAGSACLRLIIIA